MEVGGVSDLVDEHGAAVAAGLRPATDAGCEHEMVQHELTAACEDVAQVRRALRTGEDIVLLDPRHRLAAPLRRELVPGARSRLFFREESLVGGLPLDLRNDLRERFAIGLLPEHLSACRTRRGGTTRSPSRCAPWVRGFVLRHRSSPSTRWCLHESHRE